MNGGDYERIIDEIRELKNDLKESLSKIFEKMDDQNNRIISAEKDLEYLKIDLDGKTASLESDLDDYFKNFREFKNKQLPEIVDDRIEKKINGLFAMAGLNLIGLMGTVLGFLIYEFVLKGK